MNFIKLLTVVYVFFAKYCFCLTFVYVLGKNHANMENFRQLNEDNKVCD